MGWFVDYLERLSLVDYAASKSKPSQKPSPFLWKPFSRKAREAYFAQQEARSREAEERFAREKARREKMYAEQDRLHAMRQKWRMRCARSSMKVRTPSRGTGATATGTCPEW